MIHEYDNTEIFYKKQSDSRELNVIDRIRNEAKMKAQLPNMNDDHICVDDILKYTESLEREVKYLKNDKLVNELISLISAGGDIIIEDSMDMETALIIDKDINLNLNGKTLTITEDTVGDGVFHVTGGTLVIDGNGTINGVGKNDYNMAIWADGGSVVINGGTFTNEGATASSDPAHMDLIYTKNGANVEISGGFFRCETPKWTLNKHDRTESSIIVKGGTFVNYDPSKSETEPGGIVSFVAEGYKVVSETQENGEIWYKVVAE